MNISLNDENFESFNNKNELDFALNTEEFYINLISSNNYYKSLPFLISNSSNSINNHKIANEKSMFNKNKENNQLKPSLLFKINRSIPQAILENNINIIIKNMNITKEMKKRRKKLKKNKIYGIN